MSEPDFEHDRITMREASGQFVWCVRGAWFHLLTPFRRLPICRLGVHVWCGCCSPVYCIRCGKKGHD